MTELWLSLEETVPIFMNKLITNILEIFVSERNGSEEGVQLLKGVAKGLQGVLKRWSHEKCLEEIAREFSIMLKEGVVSKLKLHILPEFLGEHFESVCRSLLIVKSKTKKTLVEKDLFVNSQRSKEKVTRN